MLVLVCPSGVLLLFVVAVVVAPAASHTPPATPRQGTQSDEDYHYQLKLYVNLKVCPHGQTL